MSNSVNVPLMISLPQRYRDLLRKLAAQHNMSHPDEVLSAARLGREIIVKHLDTINQENINHDLSAQ
jgi:hypothetical protein